MAALVGDKGAISLARKEHVLSQSAVQAYYDRFGKKQDSQGFYEDPALDDLIAHADFRDIKSVFEFGCGTGKLAARLFRDHLPPSAVYLGCDISPVMVGLAQSHLTAYGQRAKLVLSDVGIRFPCADSSVDRVVSTYVLDLLPEADIRHFFSEAHRVLIAGGKLCIASLTTGINLLSRIISYLWMRVFHLNPAIVGGCRPVQLEFFLDSRYWRVVHRRVVTPFGVPSEVLILASRSRST
jgi:ubiquinone/menaquinone biosynthesis C-methylase UbiE